MVSIKMHDLIIEKHTLNGKALSYRLAHDIDRRMSRGKIAVVTEKPMTLLSSTRKQWLKIIRRVRSRRSATLGMPFVAELNARIAEMEELTFTTKLDDNLLNADVLFATAEDFVQLAPICQTIYITYDFEREKLYMLTAWMPRNALVVFYG